MIEGGELENGPNLIQTRLDMLTPLRTCQTHCSGLAMLLAATVAPLYRGNRPIAGKLFLLAHHETW